MQRISWNQASTQERPYSIYIMGPNQETCRLFFETLRGFIPSLSNTNGDQIEFLGNLHDAPAISNSFTVLHRRRETNDHDVRYTITWDPAMLTMNWNGTMPHIDAYILVFRITERSDFTALQTRHVQRIVDLCTQRTATPKRVLFLVAHKPDLFCMQQGYKPNEMQALVSKSHEIFRYGNLSRGDVCADLMTRIIKQINCTHFAYKTQSKRIHG